MKRKAKDVPVTKAVPSVLTERNITEAYVIVRASKWETKPGDHTGFRPISLPYPDRHQLPEIQIGHLWPTRAAAEKAARALMAKYTDAEYVIFKMVAQTRRTTPPIEIIEA